MTEPKRQRKFAPRSRTGCLTCRTRRKRCDSVHPTCNNCVRLNLTCEWQAQRNIVTTRSAETALSPASAAQQSNTPLQFSLDYWDVLPLIEDAASEQKHILQYYVEAYVPSVSVAASATSYYTSLYMPWAFKIHGMLDAILAISSAQLARRVLDSDHSQHLKVVSAKHEKRCYDFIKERISPDGMTLSDTYQVIATILILVGLEALNGHTNTRWISQLKCVRRIFNTLSPEQNIMDCVEIDSLHRHFTYHFASASLMARITEEKPDASAADFSLSPVNSSMIPLTTIDPLMGIGYQLCDLISRIPYVVSSNPAFPNISEASFHAIETGIMTWTYDSPFTLGLDLPVALDLIALAEAYRLAALIQLYRSSPSHASQIPACASRAMDFIVRIPPGSSAESSMLYPIFLAGAELVDEKTMQTCTKRLEEIQGRNRYENVGRVHRVLKEVWRSQSETGHRRDWEDILKEWGWSFTLG